MLFKAKNTLKLFIAFKMAYSLLFQLRGKSRFSNSSKKSFITSTTGKHSVGFYLCKCKNFKTSFMLTWHISLSNRIRKEYYILTLRFAYLIAHLK